MEKETKEVDESMKTVLDYVRLNGTYSFAEVPFCEVDNLIFCELIYVDFREILTTASDKMTIKDLGEAYFARYPYREKKRGIQPMDRVIQLFYLLKDSVRFQNVQVSNYVYEVDKNKQFGAMMFQWKQLIYIAYMGTDDSLIGWQEDCAIAYEFPVPSQKRAIEYLNEVVRWKQHRVKIGGHSKGGNLAMSAYMYARSSVKRRIEAIYNNDGPGFREEQVQTPEYQKMCLKLHTFVPEESVVGLLLHPHDSFRVVRSSEKKLLQHDGVTWECFGTKFVPGVLTKRSQQTDQMISSWLMDYSDQERKKLVKAFFQVLKQSGITKKSELDHLKITNAVRLIKELRNLKSEEQQFLIRAFRNLLQKRSGKAKDPVAVYKKGTLLFKKAMNYEKV